MKLFCINVASWQKKIVSLQLFPNYLRTLLGCAILISVIYPVFYVNERKKNKKKNKWVTSKNGMSVSNQKSTEDQSSLDSQTEIIVGLLNIEYVKPLNYDIENLVFSGGGIKDLSYPGAVKFLENLNILPFCRCWYRCH